MSFEQYVPVSNSEMLYAIIFGAVLITGLAFAIFGLMFRDTMKSMHLIPSLVIFGVIGGLAGGFFGLSAHQTENALIFQANVAQKYAVDEVKFPPNSNQKIKEDKKPTDKGEQSVMLIVEGKEYPAVLTQDEKTNEPTFKNPETNEPLNEFLR